MDKVREEMTRQKRWRRWVTGWIIVFSCLVIWGQVQNRTSNTHNKDRINDIQASRVQGCQNNYKALRQVFLPFFPPPGHRTVKQNHDLGKFNTIINRHIAKCAAQVAAN